MQAVETIKVEQQSEDEHGQVSTGIVSQSLQHVKVVFVTNICPHYRVKTFEILSRYCDVEFLFYSSGNEWYWQQNHGVRSGNFRHVYLSAFHLIRRTRTPSLAMKLLRTNYDVYIKCINGRLALPITYLVARLRRKPFVLWTGIWTSLRTPFHRLVFPLTRWIYRHADSIVVYGEHVKHYLVQQGVESEKIFVAAHAIDNEKYSLAVTPEAKAALRAKLRIENRKVVLYLGRLEKEKGLDYLIRAFALSKRGDAVLVIAGDGSLRQDLTALAKQQGVDQDTRFVGYVSPNDALEYYAIGDVYALPSVTMPTGKEPWGLVVNEAMNQGLPVIATDAVGAAAGGLVQNRINGSIVPERDVAALANAIGRVLKDDGLRAQMSRNARRIVADWTNERMVNGFRQAIEYAVKERKSTSLQING